MGRQIVTTLFFGPVGKSVNDAVNLEINPKFQAITIGQPLIALDQDIIADLSTDHKYGYRLSELGKFLMTWHYWILDLCSMPDG